MKKTIAGILFFLLFGVLSAQVVNNKDSIKQAYLSEMNDSLKVWNHINYIHALLYDYEKSKETFTEIEILKNETKGTASVEIIFWTLYFEGLNEYNNYNYLNSIIAIEKMNRLAAHRGLSERAQQLAATALITLGLNYSMINDLENAQISYQKAVKALQQLKDSSNIVLTYLNLGYIFTKSQDWTSAKKIFENGLLYLNDEANKNYAVPLYASLSMADARLGNAKQAAAYLTKAAILKKGFNSVVAEAFYEQANGENEMLLKNYPAAIKAFESGIIYARRWGDSSSISESYEGLARACWKSGNNKMALQYLIYAKNLTQQNNIADQQKSVLKTLFDFYKAGGLYKEAATVADTLLLLGDSLLAKQNNNRRIIVNALFESEQNAEQILSLQQQNEIVILQLKQKSIINYILAGSAISILSIALLSLGNYRKKKKLQQKRITDLEKEKQLLAINAMLKGQEEERSRLAQDLHDGLGGMLSGIKYSFSNMKDNLIMTPENLQSFERGIDMLDSSINELRRVAHNMMPEALMKYGLDAAMKDFCTSINSSGVIKILYQSYGMEKININPTTKVTIYRIVQELINNIIKHAAATEAVVQMNKEGSKLLLTVEDNGSGFETALLQQSKGIGWSNIQNRLDYLKGKADVQSAPGKGTSINIEIEI